MLDELDKSLETLLRKSLPKSISDQIEVSFAAPDDAFHSSAKLAVDLFLYDIRENVDLRSNDDFLERLPDGRAERSWAPARVDVSYLITAWSAEKDRPQDEHRLLGEVMKALMRFRTLPREVLAEGLREQDLPLPVSALQPGRLQSLGEFWQALGGKPKAALNYTVTLAVETLPPKKLDYLATEKIMRIDLGLKDEA